MYIYIYLLVCTHAFHAWGPGPMRVLGPAHTAHKGPMQKGHRARAHRALTALGRAHKGLYGPWARAHRVHMGPYGPGPGFLWALMGPGQDPYGALRPK